MLDSRRRTRSAVSAASAAAACSPARTSAGVAPGSPARRTGAVNSRWNSAASPSKPGHAKSITAAYSSRSFCTGVPVSSTRIGASTSLSASSVCDPSRAFRSLCASSHTSSSGAAAAASGASLRSVSYDVTRIGHRSNALLLSRCEGAFAHRSYAATALSVPPPSASAACARTPPSHLFVSAPHDPTSDAGHTSNARRAVGTPRGPWRSIVHTSARDWRDLPRPMSSARRHPESAREERAFSSPRARARGGERP